MATPQEMSDRYLDISHLHLQQAEEELYVRGDLMQASEKIWSATAQALKSVAALRGWNHKSHHLLSDIAMQLRLELGRPELSEQFDGLEAAHNNYYEHRWGADQVEDRLNTARRFVRQLEEIRQLPRPRFTPATRTQERRMEQLTRFIYDQSDDAVDLSKLPPIEPQPPAGADQ